MSGFTKIKKGNVEIEHYSTSSSIKIIVKHKEQINQQGDFKEVLAYLNIDYDTFSDLKRAIKLTEDFI